MHFTNRIGEDVARTAATPLAAYIEDYLLACESGSSMSRPLSPHTIRGYGKALRHLDELLGHPSLASFTEAMVARVISEKRKTSKSSARLLAAVAKSFATWLKRKKHTEDNRLEDLGVPIFNARRHAFSTPEARNILAALDELPNRTRRRDRAIVHLTISCGLRSNEVRTLAVGDIHITKPLEDSWALIRWDVTKSQKERMAVVPPNAAQAIREYIVHDRPDTALDVPLFLSEEGKPYTYEGWLKMWGRIADRMEAAGIKGFNAHRLRHQWATMEAANGISQAMLEQLGGWGKGSKVPSRYIDEIPFSEIQKRTPAMTVFLKRVV